jgi:hypothetical protein
MTKELARRLIYPYQIPQQANSLFSSPASSRCRWGKPRKSAGALLWTTAKAALMLARKLRQNFPLAQFSLPPTLRAVVSLRPDGVLFVIEPKAADRLENNINSLATVYYGFSIFHCMTQSLAEGGPGLGTCMGPSKTKHLLTSASFNRVEQLDIKSQTHLFYAARL